MIIGVPKELKDDEFRVAMTPAGVDLLVRAGHTVLIETGAGEGTGIPDAVFKDAGARFVPRHSDVFEQSELLVKVKEPVEEEYGLLRKDLVLFAYLHLAAEAKLTAALVKSGMLAIAYETVELLDRVKPVLTPMSEIAGRMSIQEGAKYLERPQGGRGVLLGGVPGVPSADVLILGGGVVGKYAARVAAALGARVTVMDVNLARLEYLADVLPENVDTIASNPYTIRERIREADMVVGAVLVTGERAPMLVNREMLKLMKPRSVIVDVAIDQGGCVETSQPTSHSSPIYVVENVVHYCVTNMPGAVPRSATFALVNTTIPYVLKIADMGVEAALRSDPALAAGVNTRGGEVVHPGVLKSMGRGRST